MTRKVSSNARDYAAAIVEGLEAILSDAGGDGNDIGLVAHGTTVATNAILEKSGARTGLITTEGFRDVLELRRLRMPRMYDPDWVKPEPLVERRHREEVPERLDARGIPMRELDESAVSTVIERLVKCGIQSVAICLLHSPFNPSHEMRISELVHDLAPDMDISVSALVQPEIREYERTSTTVINAYIRPIVRTYLNELVRRLREVGYLKPLWMMQSNGGLMTAEAAVERPVTIVESGPAAGVVGALEVAKQHGLAHIITFDMGGTTAKASLVEAGELTIASEYEVGAEMHIGGSRLMKGAGYLLRIPAIDIAEVGAGGGSVIWIDSGGSLRVGPRSAGADPGPAAYGRGGEDATITDANVVLGYVRSIAGGTVDLDVDRAAAVLQQQVAEPLGLSLEEAAYGARQIATHNMVQAVRAISIERGRDPRDFVLLAFGGNGPGFGADIAAATGIKRILVPPAAGVFSAVGLCGAPIMQHFVRSCFVELDSSDASKLGAIWAALESEARDAMGGETQANQRLVLSRSVDVRYVGQSSELRISVSETGDSASVVRSIKKEFLKEHRRTYGHAEPEAATEIVNVRVVASLANGLADLPMAVDGTVHGSAADDPIPGKTSREVYLGGNAGWAEVPVFTTRSQFEETRPGPCVLDLYDTTVVIPPAWSCSLDSTGNLSIEVIEE